MLLLVQDFHPPIMSSELAFVFASDGKLIFTTNLKPELSSSSVSWSKFLLSYDVRVKLTELVVSLEDGIAYRKL